MHLLFQVFQDHPDAFIRVIQVIMVRLQRVTFTALHQYLGLSAELINQGSHKKRHSPFSGSPVRSRTRENFSNLTSENFINYEQEPVDPSHKESSSASISQPVPIIINKKYEKKFEQANSGKKYHT